MNKFLNVIVILAFSSSSMTNVGAQGLKGTDLDLGEIQGRAPMPDLIPGKDDQARWWLVSSNVSRLIGMSRKQVSAAFGKGAERKLDELTYKITNGKAKKSGQISCIELRIKFKNGIVEEYSIASLRWL